MNCSSHGECVNATNGNGPDAMKCVCDNNWEFHNGSDCSYCPPPFFGDACDTCSYLPFSILFIFTNNIYSNCFNY